MYVLVYMFVLIWRGRARPILMIFGRWDSPTLQQYPGENWPLRLLLPSNRHKTCRIYTYTIHQTLRLRGLSSQEAKLLSITTASYHLHKIVQAYSTCVLLICLPIIIYPPTVSATRLRYLVVLQYIRYIRPCLICQLPVFVLHSLCIFDVFTKSKVLSLVTCLLDEYYRLRFLKAPLHSRLSLAETHLLEFDHSVFGSHRRCQCWCRRAWQIKPHKLAFVTL